MRRVRGELESDVLRRLWSAAESLTVGQLRDAFPEAERPATTTLLTILSRLEKKDLVVRRPAPGGSAYSATQSEPARAASRMSSALADVATATDRQAALVHFAGQLDDAELEVLRAALIKP